MSNTQPHLRIASTSDAPSPKTRPAELSEEELSAQIQSMREFLARYPPRRDPSRGDPSGDDPSGDDVPEDQLTAAASPTEPTDAAPAATTDAPPPQAQSPQHDDEPQLNQWPPVAQKAAPDLGMYAPTPQDELGTSLYPSEEMPSTADPDPPLRRVPWWAVAGAALVVAGVGVAWISPSFRGATATAANGTLVVETNPPGVAVHIDGGPSHVTPLRVTLPPGSHVVEVVYGSERRRIPVTLAAGSQVSHFLDLPLVIPALGALDIRTAPAGAAVSVDGQPAGRSPLILSQLTPGAHTIALRLDSTSVTERVTVEAGKTVSLVVPMGGAPRVDQTGATTSAGWITVTAPTDVQLYEDGRLLGTSRVERIMLPVGRHEIELVNEPLGYRERRTVAVSAGQVSSVVPAWPTGTAALNALPWADVFVDGQRVGETPIGRLALPVGTHEIVFRHPELGERRSSITLRVGQPARVAVDLRAP